MRPSFNIAGPCVPDEHYMVSPARRLGRVLRLIADGMYFTLHAGRQTGKTTSAFWLVNHLAEEGSLLGVWVDLQTASDQPDPATTLDSFTGGEVEELLAQHTHATGQRFEPDACPADLGSRARAPLAYQRARRSGRDVGRRGPDRVHHHRACRRREGDDHP